MKYLLLLVIIFNCVVSSYSQKRTVLNYSKKTPLDIQSTRSWCSVSNGSISDDGQYLIYYISNRPKGSATLVIKSVEGSWEKEYIGCSTATFTPDSKYLLYKKGTDSLFLQTLGKGEADYIGTASNFRILGDKEVCWFSFIDKGGDFQLFNLLTHAVYKMQSVTDYSISLDGKIIIVAADSSYKGNKLHILKWINIPDISSRIIWSSTDQIPVNYAFDMLGGQLGFITERGKDKKKEYELWFYKKGTDSSTCLLKGGTDDSTQELCNQTPIFSPDGTKLFFGQTNRPGTKNPSSLTKVDIWNYQDKVLQNVQVDEMRRSKIHTWVYKLADNRAIQLEMDNDRIVSKGNENVLIIHELGLRGLFEAYWNTEAAFTYSLVSLKDGHRTVLRDNVISYDGGVSVSPNWKWAIYYDFSMRNWFSIELSTKIKKNITLPCSTQWTKNINDYPLPSLAGWPTWMDGGKALLLYDNYDIWRIDPSGYKKPENLTHGYGAKHNMRFEIINNDEQLARYTEQKNTLLFRAFENDTKQYGFFKKTFGSTTDPELLFMGPYVFGSWNGYGSVNDLPLKAKNADVYLVTRMQVDDAPNYYVTNEFRTFSQKSNIQPQKRCNWYTSELHNWKTSGGVSLQGILYKPEDFDSTKKYPVIFEFYERRSDELNLFIHPQPSEGRINIPIFVSNGYLVFVPDISYSTGWPGKSASESLISAAGYLSKFQWVDGRRMGLQGHSFGGYETNFIITQTSLFAAACSASGFSDLMSAYNSAARGGFPMFAAEWGQNRIGANPWVKPELYIENSPVYKAHKITTPLLLMNNKNDNVVPFSQGLELFVALRRLNKKVWMLQYDNGGHEVEGRDAEDFHVRMTQFFDHYLKDKPAPVWMTRGIDARRKTFESGMEYDHEIKSPGNGVAK